MEPGAANHARGAMASEDTSRSQTRVLPPRKSKRRLSHENRILLLTLASGAAGIALALVLLWTGDHEFSTRWTLTFLVVMVWLGFAFALRSAVIRPLQTRSNM